MSEADAERHTIRKWHRRPGSRFIGLCAPDCRLTISPDGRIIVISPNEPPRYISDGMNDAVSWE